MYERRVSPPGDAGKPKMAGEPERVRLFFENTCGHSWISYEFRLPPSLRGGNPAW